MQDQSGRLKTLVSNLSKAWEMALPIMESHSGSSQLQSFMELGQPLSDIDQELLELSAEAYCKFGIEDYFEETTNKPWSKVIACTDALGSEAVWNPLLYGDQALRLAVHCLPFYSLVYSKEDFIECGGDWVAATKRAIVKKVADLARKKYILLLSKSR